MNVRTYRGDNYDSDHFLICMRYRYCIRGRKGGSPKAERMHLEKLRATETAVDNQHKLLQEFESYNVGRCNTNDIAGCTIERI